uniref:Putative ATPase subunit of terminase n=1 Tax=Otarine gammaherpesvirus 4 TaxID=2801541 RepID=A0A8B6T2V3_9GAMA|nr:putative ATPase subunit of terminase [Otarine gammaherpesvirus 4]
MQTLVLSHDVAPPASSLVETLSPSALPPNLYTIGDVSLPPCPTIESSIFNRGKHNPLKSKSLKLCVFHGRISSGITLDTNKKLLRGVSINLNCSGVCSHRRIASSTPRAYCLVRSGSPRASKASALNMMPAEMRERLAENYRRVTSSRAAQHRNNPFGKDCESTTVYWQASEATILSRLPKAERMAHPLLGIIPAVNLYSRTLHSYCTAFDATFMRPLEPCVGRARHHAESPAPLTQELTSIVQSLCPRVPPDVHIDAEAMVEFEAAAATHRQVGHCERYTALNQFLVNLSSFLNGCYVSRSTSIEPFQKQLILQTFYFLISIKAPESGNKLCDMFSEAFGLQDMSSDALRTFQQKASVQVIPRRHGKTWIVVAIVSMLLATVGGLHVGYVAHQKHVANAVFAEVISTLRRWFSARHVEVKKESSTVIFNRSCGQASTLMCATCFNKNVRLCVSILDIRQQKHVRQSLSAA